MKEKDNSLFWASVKMGLATLTSRILGLVREQVMAIVFGAGAMTDAFLVAYRIPNLLRDLFAEGAFSSAFVPTFTSLKHQGKHEARQFLWSMFSLLFLVTGALSLLIYFFAPEFISLFAPGFVSQPEKFAVTVTMTKIMSPFLLLVSLAALLVGALNSLRVFLLPSLAPAFFNLVNIVCLIGFPTWLVSRGHPAVYALGWGVLVGGIGQLLMLLPKLFSLQMGPIRPKKIITPESKKVFLMLGPGLIGYAAAQINLLITTILATSSSEGAVSWLSYAFRLFQFPVGVLGVSIASSNLVHFSDHWKAAEIEEAKSTLKSSLNLSLFALLGAMALLCALSTETVRLIFEHGKFTSTDTHMTSLALQLYLLGLPFYGVYKIFAPTFYVLDLQRIPVISSLISIVVNIIFSLTLTPRYGFSMLALGATMSTVSNALILSCFLKRRLQLKWDFFFSPRILKMMMSAALTFGGIFLLRGMLLRPAANFAYTCGSFLFLGILGVIFYLGSLLLLGEAELVRAFGRKK